MQSQNVRMCCESNLDRLEKLLLTFLYHFGKLVNPVDEGLRLLKIGGSGLSNGEGSQFFPSIALPLVLLLGLSCWQSGRYYPWWRSSLCLTRNYMPSKIGQWKITMMLMICATVIGEDLALCYFVFSHWEILLRLDCIAGLSSSYLQRKDASLLEGL